MADIAIHSLLETLSRLLKQHHHPDINQQIITIHKESVALQFSPRNPENLEEQIRDAAATTKEIIEYLLSEDNPLYGGWMKPTLEHLKQLEDLAEYFKSTVQNLKSTPVNIVAQLKDISPSVGSSRTATASKNVVVGLDEDLRVMKKWITGSNQITSQLQVLSIVGEGGIGKTTLAKVVYNDESIVRHFDIRAWVTVSQDYSVASVVYNLLASLEEGGIPVERDGHREISMESLIQTHLIRGRFLIVIDDVWSKKAWDDLKTLFPDSRSGSRIMLTTRLHEVADYVNSSIPIHFMRLLDTHDSWDLLKKKVFADESCPIQLEDIGRKIVKICGGLPLSIVIVAGILSKLPKTRCSWKEYAANHGTLETIIILSCNHLPEYMRECFLYMGGFPEDYEIRVSELIKLWIGEGFLKFQRSMSLEKEAAKILDNLVERNLVLVSRRKFDGKIKSCILHDIVRDFCVREAQREKFLLSVMDYLPTPILRRHFLRRLLKTYGRISVGSHDLNLKNSSLPTHSIICIPQGGYKCLTLMSKFSSLRVFHVLRRNNNWEWEPSQVLDLTHLNYLASNIPTSIVPSTISKFENLQTLNIYRYEVVLPMEIWKLQQLRHLMALSFASLPQPYGETPPLEKLQVMSLVNDLMCSERMMEMIPNIRKLGICCRSFAEFNIYNLGYLNQLEKLKWESVEKLQYDSRLKNTIFPPSLKKLTLCGLRLPWENMRIISSLPGLQVLKLRNYACDDTIWETTEGEFKQLEFLLVDESNLLQWRTRSSHFPNLKSLVLCRCPDLREIPDDIGNISTLEFIKVDAGNKFLLNSAKIIQEDQERKGNYKIQVCYSTRQQRELAEDPSLSSIFKHLPDHLKQCFLYMAAFPKNYEIRASEIVKLWVAEGFLRCPTETGSLEEESKDCLDDLVKRGLIFVISRKVDGKIRSCRLDYMVRDICIMEAVEYKFILPLKDCFPSPIVRRDFQRVSASWYDLEYLKDSMHSSSIQTVICIPEEGYSPEGSLCDYTSLRVLHILRRNDRLEVGGVFDHIHLTYLASNIPSSIVPPAISKLQNLRTLIIYRFEVYLPAEIWRMPKLRHLMAFSFQPLPNPEDADVPLENLQTLSLVTDFVCSERMVVMIPNIKKLGLDYSGQNVEELKLGFPRSFWTCIPRSPKSNLSSGYHLDNLAQLLHLEKLKLEMPTSFWASLPVFPQSLKKLTLCGGGLRWRDMTIIGSLPNLQELKLRHYAIRGAEWETTLGEFPQLRFLLIDGLDLGYWKTESRHFPRLQWLILHRCRYLSEIPSEIGGILTLELIEVGDGNRFLLDSAKRIETELLKINGARNFEVRVKRFDAHSK